jgi:hypothetical protein
MLIALSPKHRTSQARPSILVSFLHLVLHNTSILSLITLLA